MKYVVGSVSLLLLTSSGVNLLEPADAQSVVPATDGTGTQVTSQGDRFTITGGQRSRDGVNLFHSFERFGLNTREIAEFRSNPSIQNILARVVGGNPSIINGLLQVTGGNSNLFLINPAGILFGANARLDLPASFTATTANGIGFSEGWLNATGEANYASLVGTPNTFAFSATQPGAIVNVGDLAVGEGQSLTLLAGNVVNTGQLSAPGGQITIAAVPGENLVRVSQDGLALSLEIQPITDGGQSLGVTPLPFSPVSLPELLTGGNLDNASGITVDTDGTVRLGRANTVIPTTPGTAIASGTLDTSATSTTATPTSSTGGTIRVLGDMVGLLEANINANGPNGGGTVLIGGDRAGGETLPQATRTFVSQDSVITANASDVGNGGRVTITSDEATRFDGQLAARGGPAGGNGGSADISGAGNLIVQGTTDLGADKGAIGNLRLSSTDVTVVPDDGSVDTSDLSTFFTADLAATTTLTDALLNSQTANTTIAATNDIDISPDTALDFRRDGGDITVQADADQDGVGDFTVQDPGTTIATNGRNLSILGANLTVGAITTQGGNLTLETDGDIATGSLSTSAPRQAGNIILRSHQGTIDTTGGSLQAGSNNQPGGNIILAAQGAIDTADLEVGSTGTLTLTSETGGITTGSLTAGSERTGGAIALTAADDISTGRLAFGSLTIATPGTIDLTAGLNGSGDIALGSPTTRASDILLPDRLNTRGGNLSLWVDNPTYRLDSSISTQGGEFTLNNTGAIQLLESLRTAGGAIQVQGSGIVASRPLDSGNNRGEGGAIALTAATNSIQVDNLDSSGRTAGGAITVTAPAQIRTGVIDAHASQGNGGAIALQGNQGVQIQAATTEGGSTGTGGNINVVTNGSFQATDILPGRSGRASLATTGGQPGGTISIRHGQPSFTVGDATQNGTAGALTTGTETFAPSLSVNGNLRSDRNTIQILNGSNQSANITLPNRFETDFTSSNRGVRSTPPSMQSGSTPINFGTILQNNQPIQNSQQIFTPPNSGTTLQNNPSGTPQLPSRIVTNPIATSIAQLPNQTIVDSATSNVVDRFPTSPTSSPSVARTAPASEQHDQPDSTLANPGVIVPNNAPGSTFEPISRFEARFTDEYKSYLDLGNLAPTTTEDPSAILRQIEAAANIQPALFYVSFTPTNANAEASPTDELELVLVTGHGTPIRKRIAGVTRSAVEQAAAQFRGEITNPRRTNSTTYLKPAQRLYQWFIAPMESELQAQHINNLAFILDAGLRSLPLAALHDGKQFLVEKYSLGLMPSLSLTDTHYVDIRNTKVLAMGASQFNALPALPAVPVELSTITRSLWPGTAFLNSTFTPQNLLKQRQEQPYNIVHLATHSEFKPGAAANSYIQFWNQKVTLDQMRQLNLNSPPVDLLVLSACRTALGDEQAELGFAGVAVKAGARSVLASLWYVSDEGTLGFMTEFYRQLHRAPIKAEALRQAQIAMLKGEVRLDGEALLGPGGEKIPLPSTLTKNGSQNLSHPFYWAAFTLVGSPW
jgi:filamentous hemagglutinin family protein